MSVKPTVMPISPNDARSAIRVQKQLEMDILRLREDIKRRTCNIPAARQAIALKERQMTQIQAYLRQYHIDLDQFDRREAERQRQAMRRQHAIFEDQRRAAVPGKHSAITKKARLDNAVDELPPSVLPAPITLPPVIPAEAAAKRRAAEEAAARARKSVAQQQAALEERIAQQRRGQQALLEQRNRLKSKAEERAEQVRQLTSESKNIIANEAARQQKAAEEKRDLAMKAAHEKKMAEENARRAAEAKAKEEARIAKEKAEQMAREKAAREMQAKQEAQEKRARAEMLRNRNGIERQYHAISEQIRQMEQVLNNVTMEMRSAKMANPEVMDDLREHRARITEELVNLKRQAGPLEAELRRMDKQMQTTFMADNTAGLRAWHRDLLSTRPTRKLSAQDREFIFGMMKGWEVPADLQRRVQDVIARWENGVNVDLEQEIADIVLPYLEARIQAQQGAAALGGTPRHVKHGMSAVAQNNYKRLRAIQQTEDSVKQESRAAEEAATAQGESLAGLFPKLRSSVTRMVGH